MNYKNYDAFIDILEPYDMEANENERDQLQEARKYKPTNIYFFYGIMKEAKKRNGKQISIKIYKIEANIFDKCAQKKAFKISYNSALYNNDLIFLDIEKTDLKRLNKYTFTEKRKKDFLLTKERKNEIFYQKIRNIADQLRTEQEAEYKEASTKLEALKNEPYLYDALLYFKPKNRAFIIKALDRKPPYHKESAHDKIKAIAETYKDLTKHDFIKPLYKDLMNAKKHGYIYLTEIKNYIETNRRKWRLKIMFKEKYERAYKKAIDNGLTEAEAKARAKKERDKNLNKSR